MGAHICASMDQTYSTHCSWSGTPLTASAPKASSPFSPRSLKRLRGRFLVEPCSWRDRLDVVRSRQHPSSVDLPYQGRLRGRKRCCNFHGVNAGLPHLLRRSLKEQDHDPPTFDDVPGTLERLSTDGVQHHLHLGTLRQRGMFRRSILGGIRGKRWHTRDVL